jgi:hypothetical protein
MTSEEMNELLPLIRAHAKGEALDFPYTMSSKRAAELLPVMEAFADGKQIEYRWISIYADHPSLDAGIKWSTVQSDTELDFSPHAQYRIKATIFPYGFYDVNRSRWFRDWYKTVKQAMADMYGRTMYGTGTEKVFSFYEVEATFASPTSVVFEFYDMANTAFGGRGKLLASFVDNAFDVSKYDDLRIRLNAPTKSTSAENVNVSKKSAKTRLPQCVRTCSAT